MPRVQSLKDKAVRMPAQVAVIYARYSSDSQREASIEDQLRECRQWAEAHGFQVVEEYCDYAISGRTDDRPQFQKMIADAEKGMFSAVIMYQTSRFARNRYDAALYKHRLKKAGVAVHYAAMSIPDGPEGIILEALMEGMDEYYSANLSKNIRRGQEGNALKGIAMNAAPIGLRINEKRMYDIDPNTGPHVLRAFQMIDEGRMQVDVLAYFNSLGIRTSKGNPFNKSSLRTMWRNRKYLGEYQYRDVVIPNIIPQLIPDDLFHRVNARIDKNKFTNGGRARSMTEFLLTGKLICGHCGKPMIGCSGTGKSGAIHYYYSCTTRRREHKCDKSNERKEALEIAIVRETIQHVLQPAVLSSLIDHAMAILEKESLKDPILRTLEVEKKTVETSLRNLMRAIEDGLYTPTTKKRLEELEQQQTDIASRIAVQKSSRPVITREHLQYFLESFRDGDLNDPDHRRRVIDALVHSVTISDTTSDDDGSKPMRRLQIMYNLTQNSNSSIDLTSLDGSTAVELAPLTLKTPSCLLRYGGVLSTIIIKDVLMMVKTYEELLDTFIAACMMRKDVDYADKASVRRYNKGMDICRQMVAKLASDYPGHTERFSVLLKSEDDVIAHMCAFCMLDLLALPSQIEIEALSVVKKYFETEEPFISYEEWLEDWKKQRPQVK